MCTILIGIGTDERWPVVIAANRDEFFTRPSTPPQILGGGVAPILAGIDEVAGGTWLGVTTQGFFVGLTNQQIGRPARQAPHSRGAVVLGALRIGNTAATHDWLRQLSPQDYGPFNLIYGDTNGLWMAYFRPNEITEHALIPNGLHVLPNGKINSPHFPKVARARALSNGRLETLEAALADTHAGPLPPRPSFIPMPVHRALHRLCVRTALYGTVSATSIALAPGRVARYRFADGAPDRTPFVNQTLPL